MNREGSAQRCKTKGRSCWIGGDPSAEEIQEDVDDEADSHQGPSVLWEKCLEQSIFVDIGDDDSLHLSDLQGSFRVHVSQGPESMHSSGENAGLSGSYEVEEDSSGSPSSINSEHRDYDNIRDVQINLLHASVPKPNTAQEGDNTSDEDQEELPYDGEHSYNTLHTQSSKGTFLELHTVNEASKQSSEALQILSSSKRPTNGSLEGQKLGRGSASVPEFLLRHFSQDELLRCGRLIEAETLPEVSLLESIDETAFSRAPPSPNTAVGVTGLRVNTKANPSLLEENESSRGESHVTSEETKTESQRRNLWQQRTEIKTPNNTDPSVNHSHIYSQSDPTVESRMSTKRSPDGSAEEENEGKEDGVEQSCSASTPNLCKADVQVSRLALGRTRSCTELKYGQGQVHYPLPDFSKVAPKVKIPKGNGPTKPAFHTSTTDRTHTAPSSLGKSAPSCTADVISRVLEDSLWLTELRKDEDEQSRMDQLLQEEYDRLLAKYAEDDSLINQIRLRGQCKASNEQSPSTHWRETIDVLNMTHGKASTRAAPQTSQSTITRLVEEKRDAVWSLPSEEQSMSEGQRLTTELTTIINQFTEKVEEFKICISNMSLSVEEQQMMFKSMMEAQDQLERNYMSKKEEHRVLEMQNYMGLDRNTGQFDPDRQVEGDIFRLGMQLEDVKEQIDRNAHRVLSPPPASSTPILPPHGELICSSSHQPTLHEGSVLTSGGHSEREEEEHSKVFMKEYGDSLLSESENSYRLRPEDRGSPTQEPQEEYTNIAQRFVSPETDSGLCTSDQSRPPTGLSDTQRGTESSLPPEDLNGMTSASTSDNDVSLSNLHTVFSFTTGWQPDQLPKTMQNMQENPNSQKATAGLHTLGEDRLWVQEGATLHSPLLQEPSQEGQSALTQKPLATEKQIRGQFSLCSCPNSEAISALQYEVSCLKRALDESLCHLSHPGVRTEPRSSVCSQEKRLRTRPRVRHRHRTNSSRCPTADTSLQEEDWSSSDVELSKHKGIDSRDSDNSEIPASYSRTHKGTRTHCRSPSSRTLQDLKCSSKTSLESLSQETSQSKPGKHHLRATVGSGSNVSIRSLTGHISDGCIGPLCNNRRAADRPTHHSRKAATVPVWDDHGGHGSVVLTIHKSRDSSVYRQPDEYLRSRNRHHYLPPHPHGKPLLQTNYGSCNSLPPGFKVWDQQSDSEVSSRRRSTQSDSAMLPANVYFQRTSPVPNTPGRSRARPWGQRASKEEAINKTLDKALEVALLMKKTTDRMAKTLSADLAKARIYKTVTRDPTCQ